MSPLLAGLWSPTLLSRGLGDSYRQPRFTVNHGLVISLPSQLNCKVFSPYMTSCIQQELTIFREINDIELAVILTLYLLFTLCRSSIRSFLSLRDMWSLPRCTCLGRKKPASRTHQNTIVVFRMECLSHIAQLKREDTPWGREAAETTATQLGWIMCSTRRSSASSDTH